MLRRPRSLPVTLAALLVSAAGVSGQNITSPFRFIDDSQALGIFGGYVLTDTGELDLGPEDAPAFGLRYSIRISGPFMIEGEASYVPSTRTVYDTARIDGGFEPLGEADLSLALLQAALRFNITGPRTYYGFQPYFLLGGGAAVDVSDSDAAFRDELVPENVVASDVVFDFGTTFAAQVGAGFEWFISRRITLRADVRDVFWEIEAPPAFVEPGVGVEPDLDAPSEEWLQNFFFLLGVSYRF